MRVVCSSAKLKFDQSTLYLSFINVSALFVMSLYKVTGIGSVKIGQA